MRRWALFVVLAVLVLGAGVNVTARLVSAQVITPEVAPPVTDTGVVTIRYGGDAYEIHPDDGPVVAFVDRAEIDDAGVTLSGVVVVQDAGGWRIAGTWVDPAPGTLDATVGDVLTLTTGDDDAGEP